MAGEPSATSSGPAPALRKERRRLRQARALIIGTAVILAGVAISPLPGPGFMVLGPVGLGILAGEFMWARRIRARLESGERDLRGAADRVAVRISRLFILPVIALFWAVAWWISKEGIVPARVVWALSFPLFVPVGYLALRVAAVRARKRAEGEPRPES
ncbi:MAG TPA: hypothetical protein DEB06_02660 [Phycisphaerales bacterium]|nr:hypothetical protein [Phycisphaerales bacterium]